MAKAMEGLPEGRRPLGTPSAATARKIGLMLDLLRWGALSIADCARAYGCSERTVLRDLQELRTVGEELGFVIGRRRERDGIVELTELRHRPRRLRGEQQRLVTMIAAVLDAFGAPLAAARSAIGAEPEGSRFLRIALPRLADDAHVKWVYDQLEAAWRINAKVRIEYAGHVREVEPYAVTIRSGRYYLLARDRSRGGSWRRFALDRIGAKIVRAGSFTPVSVPPRLLADDAVGWLEGDDGEVAVRVRIAERLARTVTSRNWQRRQRL